MRRSKYTPEQKAAIKGLRELARFIEQNPHLPGMTFYSSSQMNLFIKNKEDLAAWARALGTCKKNGIGDYFWLEREFGTVSLHINASRSDVCERVSLGMKTVTEEVPDPQAPKVTVTTEVEEFEWRCPESILGGVA